MAEKCIECYGPIRSGSYCLPCYKQRFMVNLPRANTAGMSPGVSSALDRVQQSLTELAETLLQERRTLLAKRLVQGWKSTRAANRDRPGDLSEAKRALTDVCKLLATDDSAQVRSACAKLNSAVNQLEWELRRAPRQAISKADAEPMLNPVTRGRALVPEAADRQNPATAPAAATTPLPFRPILACNTCGSPDVQRLYAVWHGGTSPIDANTAGVGGGLAKTRETQAKVITANAAPPKPQHEAGWWLGLFIGVMLLIGGFTSGGSMPIWGFLISGVCGWIAWDRHQYNAEEYPKLFSRWQKTFQCMRCGQQFVAQQI